VTGNPRVAALGAVVGAVVTLLAVLVVYGAAWAVNAMFPSPDANIGLGLATLVTTAVLIPLGVWLVLRRLRVRVAGPIAAGTAVVYLVVLFVQRTAVGRPARRPARTGRRVHRGGGVAGRAALTRLPTAGAPADTGGMSDSARRFARPRVSGWAAVDALPALTY
jgi:glucose dehydrogenase